MAYSYRSRRSVHRLASRSRRNFIVTLIIVAILAYSTITWILPAFISSIGVVKNIINPQKTVFPSPQNSVLAPPVLNIPYEATNTAQIDIKGFGTSGAKVKLYLDDALQQTVEVRSDGSFNFENVSLMLGTNNIYGTTLDNQESLPSKTIKLIFDNEKPYLTISEPDDKTIQGGDKKVKVSGKTDSGAHIFINGSQVIVDKDGNFGTDLTLNDGENVFFIKAIDRASNTKEVERHLRYNP